MTELVFKVRGLPVPQGSKNAYVNKRTGRVNLVEAQGAKLEVWRTQIALAARNAASKQSHNGTTWEQPDGPIQVNVDFYLPRPKAHYRTGKHAGKLKDWAPRYCAVKPDSDKLLRALYDGLTMSGTIQDDAQIVAGIHQKLYANTDEGLGAAVLIHQIKETA